MTLSTLHRRFPLARMAVLLLLASVWTASERACHGVVLDGGDGTGNTIAPEDDPGFANVGTRGIASAVYLGNRWVLTASHVGAGSVTLDGTEYSHVPDEVFRLTNTDDDLSNLTDILLFRLEEDPGLPSLRLPCFPTPLGTEFTMIGRGHDRALERTAWDVEVVGGRNNDIWTVADDEEGDRQGYLTQESQTVRWGRGLATLTNFDTESGFGDVLSIQSTFDPNLNVENLSQAVRGDSGGGVFQNTSGVWELIGMIHAVSLIDNQPTGTRSAIYGNDTFIADLYRYADQIREIANFEPELGDLNGDGQIDDVDIDALLDVVRIPGLASCHYDIANNGSLNGEDVDAIVALAGGVLGDANLDGTVGFADFLTLSGSFGDVDTRWHDGDFDGDDQVTFADFLILSTNFGNSVDSLNGTIRSAASVPEPNHSHSFLALGVLAIWAHLRFKRTAGLRSW